MNYEQTTILMWGVNVPVHLAKLFYLTFFDIHEHHFLRMMNEMDCYHREINSHLHHMELQQFPLSPYYKHDFGMNYPVLHVDCRTKNGNSHQNNLYYQDNHEHIIGIHVASHGNHFQDNLEYFKTSLPEQVEYNYYKYVQPWLKEHEIFTKAEFHEILQVW
jgi:hypothetical protein